LVDSSGICTSRGASHAFLDWKPDQKTQDTFDKYGKYYAQQMLAFFDDVLK
jgi:alpha/beta hydrolase fold-3 domain protein